MKIEVYWYSVAFIFFVNFENVIFWKSQFKDMSFAVYFLFLKPHQYVCFNTFIKLIDPMEMTTKFKTK
jgi:hypothetical protein